MSETNYKKPQGDELEGAARLMSARAQEIGGFRASGIHKIAGREERELFAVVGYGQEAKAEELRAIMEPYAIRFVFASEPTRRF